MKSRILLFLLTLLIAAPTTLMVSSSDAFAQRTLQESRKPGQRTHKVANQKKTRTVTKTRTSRPAVTHHRPVHRHHVTHHRTVTPHRTVVRYGRYDHSWGYRYVHRPRYYVWGTRHVHHYERPVVIINVEEPEPTLPELECPVHTQMVQTDNETWCATDRGYRHGPFVRYHNNGEVAEEGWYEYGTKEGVWVQYHSNGALKSEGAYTNNDRVGLWVNFDRNGDEISSTHYR